MAIISVSATDTGQVIDHWDVPPAPILDKSPIPRGRRNYGGTVAVAALGAGDETNVAISFTFPRGYVYLPKNISIEFASDDLTTEFSNQGILEYQPGGVGAAGTRETYQLSCIAPAFRLAVSSLQIYEPLGTWRHWVDGEAGDVVVLLLADISGDTSTAGDVSWTAEFLEFDVQQFFSWPINTPRLTLEF